ncbi:hypothetical protein [Kamptonema formosum]|uniref:hypothetical protein n=1 Tax=Kamptonema formosum TaxID=331992 RepID=UPI00034DBA03|nr:hypothetical protein [Oscillatoria sp. PCC 10802]
MSGKQPDPFFQGNSTLWRLSFPTLGNGPMPARLPVFYGVAGWGLGERVGNSNFVLKLHIFKGLGREGLIHLFLRRLLKPPVSGGGAARKALQKGGKQGLPVGEPLPPASGTLAGRTFYYAN